jgi:rhodanese-related sulfurtransferase
MLFCMGKQQQPKERKDAILVDVRDENEFRSGYIHGAVSEYSFGHPQVVWTPLFRTAILAGRP